MTVRSARVALAVTWGTFFVLQIGAVFVLKLMGWIEGENFADGLKLMNDLYAPYVGAIITYAFTAPAPSAAAKPDRTRFLAALLLTLLWNTMLLVLMLSVFVEMESVEQAMKSMKLVGGLFSWLVAAAIGLYFARPAVTEG